MVSKLENGLYNPTDCPFINLECSIRLQLLIALVSSSSFVISKLKNAANLESFIAVFKNMFLSVEWQINYLMDQKISRDNRQLYMK
jgi:hypothetical protein